MKSYYVKQLHLKESERGFTVLLCIFFHFTENIEMQIKPKEWKP